MRWKCWLPSGSAGVFLIQLAGDHEQTLVVCVRMAYLAEFKSIDYVVPVIAWLGAGTCSGKEECIDLAG